MELTINTPALLFPAISLVLLAYTNRFLGLSSVVRKLHEQFRQNKGDKNLQLQINSLRYRLKLIRRMQFFGVLSFVLSMATMYFLFLNLLTFAHYTFAASIISFSVSLIFSLVEIMLSTKALEIELEDMEEDTKNIFDFVKSKLE